MKTRIWIQKNMPLMTGKTVAISGATGGLGQELCRHLAGLGAELLLLDRNSERSNAWIEKLKKVLTNQRSCGILCKAICFTPIRR